VTNAPVTVIVPTHDHAAMLELSVRSILEQSFADVDVVVIGDGVRDDTRDVVAALATSDERVAFHDLPKAGRTGEPHRHAILSQIKSQVVAYHGDDDLLLPNHLQTMLDLLEGRDFACPLPITIRADGRPQYLPVDLADPAWVAWQTDPRRGNRVSLTGVAHTLESYRRLPFGWRATPAGQATDHYMWRQYLALDGIRAATAHRSTTVKFAGQPRREVPAPARAEELRSWWDRIHAPGFDDEWDAAVQLAIRSAALRASLAAGSRTHGLGARFRRALSPTKWTHPT
jgi:hypothetical protein